MSHIQANKNTGCPYTVVQGPLQIPSVFSTSLLIILIWTECTQRSNWGAKEGIIWIIQGIIFTKLLN